MGPAIQSSLYIWAILWSIIVLELIAGLLAAKGALDLWFARNGSADEFNDAKTYAILGSGLGVIIWFGLFGAVAGAYFQMWQTVAGSNAATGAFQYVMQMGIVLLIINAKD